MNNENQTFMKNKTIDNYALPVLNLTQKIKNNKDFSAECDFIKQNMTNEEKSEISNQLFDQISRTYFKQQQQKEVTDYLIPNLIKAIRQIGYIDEQYINDYLRIFNYNRTQQNLGKQELMEIIQRFNSYQNVAKITILIRQLTNIVTMMDDDELSIALINQLKSL